MIKFFISILSFLFSISIYAESPCKGLSESSCKANSECTWVSGYTRKDGAKVDAYCRAKPGKGDDEVSKPKKDKEEPTKKEVAKEKKSKNEKEDKEEKEDKKSKKSKKDKEDKDKKKDRKSSKKKDKKEE